MHKHLRQLISHYPSKAAQSLGWNWIKSAIISRDREQYWTASKGRAKVLKPAQVTWCFPSWHGICCLWLKGGKLAPTIQQHEHWEGEWIANHINHYYIYTPATDAEEKECESFCANILEEIDHSLKQDVLIIPTWLKHKCRKQSRTKCFLNV